MFILLKSGAMFNLFWLQDCFQGKHDKNIVIFYTVNGAKLIEEYDTEEEAQQRVNEVHGFMQDAFPGFSFEVVKELPTTNISTTKLYLVPVTEEGNDLFKEYRYINGKWEDMGVQKLELKPIEDKLAEVENMLEWHEY